MKFLIIEDNEKKAKSIREFVSSQGFCSSGDIFVEKNYLDGKRALRTHYDFLILDMTLPLDDTDENNKISTAGIDILEVMKHHNLILPCVVLTQYDTFGKHQSKVNLTSLTENVIKEYANIVKAVIFYDSENGDWQEKLKKVIAGVA